MAFFAEYLLQEGLIQQEQLLEALIEQIETQPSVIKVVREIKMLGTQDILQVLKCQAEHQLSFQEAAKKLSLWDHQKSERLFAELSIRRTPLVEILVKMNALSLESLTKAFDDFFRGKEQQSVSPQPQGEPLHPEVFDYLNDAFLAGLSASLEQVAAQGSYDLAKWSQHADEIHKIQGAANLYEFHGLAEFMKRIEGGLREVLLRDPQKVNSEVIQKMRSAFQDAHVLMSEVLQAHRARTLSSQFFSEPSHADKVKVIYDWFTLIEFDLGHLDKRSVA